LLFLVNKSFCAESLIFAYKIILFALSWTSNGKYSLFQIKPISSKLKIECFIPGSDVQLFPVGGLEAGEILIKI